MKVIFEKIGGLLSSHLDFLKKAFSDDGTPSSSRLLLIPYSVAAIFALFKSNPKLSAIELAEHGLFIGREHIVSLVNTLVLAYAGSSLPIFIFFILNPSHLPIWVIVNNESVSEELVRTVAGSMGLILAIPITTLFATWYVTKRLRKS